MKGRRIGLQEILADCVPNTPWETVEASVLTDLDADSPRGKAETAVFLFRDFLRVYVNRQIKSEVPTSEIAAFVLQKGVGCVYAECRLTSGEAVVLAKGNASAQDEVAAFVRSANRALERVEQASAAKKEQATHQANGR